MSSALSTIPQTPFALVSGSAGWGLDFPEDLHEPGLRVLEKGLRFETPWGITENWQLFEYDGTVTLDGKPRQVLNVFSHGWRLDAIDHSTHRQVGWVLGQAGASKILADSTCGSLNRAVQPGDFVVPSDVIDLSQTAYSTLPGRFRYLCRGSQMFCPAMGGVLELVAREGWPAHLRVYGPGNHLVVAHTWGPRLETPAEARALTLLGGDVANQSIAPDATAAREIGACFASATYSVNYVDGVMPGEWGDLDQVHQQCGRAAAQISLRFMGRMPLDTACDCGSYRTARPDKYGSAITADE